MISVFIELIKYHRKYIERIACFLQNFLTVAPKNLLYIVHRIISSISRVLNSTGTPSDEPRRIFSSFWLVNVGHKFIKLSWWLIRSNEKYNVINRLASLSIRLYKTMRGGIPPDTVMLNTYVSQSLVFEGKN